MLVISPALWMNAPEIASTPMYQVGVIFMELKVSSVGQVAFGFSKKSLMLAKAFYWLANIL
jgi:hypothetical protein